MSKVYRVVVDSEADTLASVEDTLDGDRYVCPPKDTVTFEIQGQEKFERLTPMLFELDSRDDFEVTVEEL